ncbi:MAG TPA: YihY/virulence factor BrkB family protein [Puia sp.]|nr:YihY/virulence factor BrkB family protein [Puia sp.]
MKKNDPLRMAGATAFFASFSLPFILIILIQLFGLVLDRHEVSQQLFKGLSGVLGDSGQQQVRTISRGFRRLATNWYIAAGGFIFLLFVVTTLFKVIKDSINQLWDLHPAGEKLSEIIVPRLRSIGLILLAGVLFLGDLTLESFLVNLRHSVTGLSGMGSSVLFFILQQLLSLLIVTGWIFSLFLYLPDGRFSFRVTFRGAVLTGVLFTIGKFILGWLLISSNIQRLYGTAGAFVIVLLFVFYIALILYYGAAYTAVLAGYHKESVRPAAHARSLGL